MTDTKIVTGMRPWVEREWTRVIVIRGWARGRVGWVYPDGAYTVIKFDPDEYTNFYYSMDAVRESDDELSDFVILTRTENRV